MNTVSNTGAVGIGKPHRNITFQRLVLDLYQFFRAQKLAVRCMGRQFSRSRRYIEIDITYRCNLKCINCNRSCTQVPSGLLMELSQVADFIGESIETGARWERIRILGGEPTLHPDFSTIVKMLCEFKKRNNPSMRIVVCTNGCGEKVKTRLAQLPQGVEQKNTFKRTRRPLFRPFNMAPVDSRLFRFSDFSSGCRIISECGLGLTPTGYYPCAISGGIDRVFKLNLGKKRLPLPDDDMLDQLRKFCPLCGHFGFRWPTRKTKMSSSWIHAYRLSGNMAAG